MAIKIEFDRICFGNFVFCEDASGVAFDGCACANEFCDGRVFQGTVSGYTSGGYTAPFADTVDKFPFAADASATDVGELTQARRAVAGQSSSVSGYTSAGRCAPTPNCLDTIDKFPFAADASATDVGEISQARRTVAGQSTRINGFGYVSGGSIGAILATIDKFPFSSDTNATDIGDLSVARCAVGGQSSKVSGYTSGGKGGPPSFAKCNIIDKFPFSSDTNATDVGDLTVARMFNGEEQSSSESGYSSGGYVGPPPTSQCNIIDKFPFATDGNATDVGDLSQTRSLAAGQSSLDNGYVSGGFCSGPTQNDTIDKFPFSSDTNATDVGELTQDRLAAAGQQV